jgi:glycosyltransferase involved in cell wall biosynthesis
MKILHIITSIDKGGAENQLFCLVKGQINLGNKVYIIFFKGNHYWKKYLKKIGAKVYYCPYQNFYKIIKLFKFFFIINKIIKKIEPKVIHAHLSLSELVGFLLKIKYKHKIRFVITKHLGSFFFEGSTGINKFFSGLFLEKIVLKKADHIIFISKEVKKYFLNSIKIPKRKISVIYYGYELKKIDVKIQKDFYTKYKIDKDHLIICSISRHVKQKNLPFLIKVFAKINKELEIKSKLILVGKGTETNLLKQLAIDLKISNKIIWIKHCEHIREFIKIIDIFCLTSDYEGLGLVILEAMAEKKPIIATNISAIPEIIRNNFNGVLFEKENQDSFIAGFKKIFYNNKFKNKIITNGYTVLKKKFTIQKMINNNLRIYNL